MARDLTRPNEKMDTTIPFGKHRGTALRDIPYEYLKWLAGYEFWPEHRDFVRTRASARDIAHEIAESLTENARDGKFYSLEGEEHPIQDMDGMVRWAERELMAKTHRVSEAQKKNFHVRLFVETRHSEWPGLAVGELRRRRCCLHCGGRIQPIGNARANGRPHDDWDERKMHKRCWMELCKETGAFDIYDGESSSGSDSEQEFEPQIGEKKRAGSDGEEGPSAKQPKKDKIREPKETEK